jgi:putative membrane protein
MRAHKIITGAIVTGALLLSGTQMLRAQVNATTQDTKEGQRGQLSESDYRFLEKAARGGMEEVELGQLAQQKGTSQEVRNFGQRMVADHTKLNNELKQIASQKGATLPTQLSHHENSSIQHLQNATGADFDKTYSKDMVKDHQKDLKEFQSAAQKVTDPDLRTFAQKAVATLQEHLSLAENIENNIKTEK